MHMYDSMRFRAMLHMSCHACHHLFFSIVLSCSERRLQRDVRAAARVARSTPSTSTSTSTSSSSSVHALDDVDSSIDSELRNIELIRLANIIGELELARRDVTLEINKLQNEKMEIAERTAYMDGKLSILAWIMRIKLEDGDRYGYGQGDERGDGEGGNNTDTDTVNEEHGNMHNGIQHTSYVYIEPPSPAHGAADSNSSLSTIASFDDASSSVPSTSSSSAVADVGLS